MRHPTRFLTLLIGAALLGACGSTARPGDPERGRAIFDGTTEIAGGNVPICISCHAIQAGEQSSIGNNLSNVGNRAAVTVRGQNADAYLRAAILDPDAYLVEGYQEGIHPRVYPQALTDQQVNDLIAYLLTLRSGED